MTFGEWLRETRAINGFTLQLVALDAGVSKSYIWDLEHDRKNPTLSVATRIAGVFGQQLWQVVKKLEVP